MIRHCVEESNVDEEMHVVDCSRIRHVTLKAGRIESMSGLVDPASHLNLDYTDHRATTCIIAEKFENGAKVRMDDDGLLFAFVPRSAFAHLGHVDYTQRLTDLIKAVKHNQETGGQKKDRAQ
jgi:hypothetical protein